MPIRFLTQLRSRSIDAVTGGSAYAASVGLRQNAAKAGHVAVEAVGRSAKVVLATAALAIGVAGCGEQQQPATSAGPREDAVARQIDGLYGAELAADTLRDALSEIKPPVRLSGGWWTLTIDVGARRLNIRHSQGDNVELRVTRVGDGHLELAPDTACEQRGAARTEPARLNWTRSGQYLRFHAVHVPCLTDQVLLTLTAWQES